MFTRISPYSTLYKNPPDGAGHGLKYRKLRYGHKKTPIFMSFNFSIHPLKIFFTLKALLNSLCLLFLSLRQKHCSGNVSYQTLSYSFIDFRCSKPPWKILAPILENPNDTLVNNYRSFQVNSNTDWLFPSAKNFQWPLSCKLYVRKLCTHILYTWQTTSLRQSSWIY